MAREDIGICEACREEFTYRLIHNGFNDSAFAYCDRCGCTAMLSGWHDAIPHTAKLKVHGPVNAEAEALLERCPCGGTFRATASPRCPKCNAELSAEAARSYIEANAPGTQKGWRWQGAWTGTYCLIVANRQVSDNWVRR